MPAVLLIDSDDNHRRSVAIALRLEGLEVVEASGSEDAIRAAAARRFDVVVLDLMLPGDPEAIIAASGARRVIATGPYPELERRLGKNERSVSFIPKPFTVAALQLLLAA
jgi:DNA-binding response OmpR family regulator